MDINREKDSSEIYTTCQCSEEEMKILLSLLLDR